VEEDLLAVFSANEPEAAITHHLLDAALRLRSGGSGCRTRCSASAAASSTASSGTARVVALAQDELVQEQLGGNDQILQVLSFGREQHFVFSDFHDAVAKAGILVGALSPLFDLVERQHRTTSASSVSVRRRRESRRRGRGNRGTAKD
jgi:hypothetical protein